MKRLLVILSITVLAGAAFAASHIHDQSVLDGTGSISGIVTDAVTSDPVEGAKVSAGCCGGRYAYTNEDGEYTLSDLADGEYTAKVMKKGLGCSAYPDEVVIENSNAVEGIDIYLVRRCTDALDQTCRNCTAPLLRGAPCFLVGRGHAGCS